MTILGKILSLLWRSWFVFLACTSTIFLGTFLILPFCFHEKHFNQAYYFLRIWSKIVFYGSGLSLKKHKFQNFESHHPYIIIANHTSMMDIMLMFILNKNPMVFVGKKELVKLPIFGFIFNKLHIAVDRKNPNSRMQVFRACSKKIKEGKSICIFPEGGVPKQDVFLDKFMDGPFAIAVMHKIPLVTLTICGLKEILPYAYFQGKPDKVHVFFNSWVETKDFHKKDIEKLKMKSRAEIEKTLQACQLNNIYN